MSLKAAAVGVELGVELQERLVDRAELFGAEVAVVDRPADALLLDRGELADRIEQVAVGELGGIEVGTRVGSEQEAAERRQAEPGAPSSEPSAAMTTRSAGVEVGVAGALAPLCQTAQPGGRVEAVVAVRDPLSALGSSRRSRSSATNRRMQR